MNDLMSQAKMREAMVMKQAAQSAMIGGYDIQPPTIRENIDRQIESHMSAIARLEQTKANLGKANLLDMKISDLREAMQF